MLYILDDDEQYSQLLKDALESEDFKVEVCNCSEQFVTHIPKNGILILDLFMPKMDGIEVIRHIALSKSELRLVLISGFDDKVLFSAKELANAHGLTVEAVLTKPINIQSIFEIAERGSSQVRPSKAALPSVISTDNNHLYDDLLRACAHKEFELYYQPQVTLADRVVVGVEVLVRWHHPTLGLLYPDAFIPFAEETGLITQLTETIIKMAFSQRTVWQTKFAQLHFSINISSQDVLSLFLPNLIEELCEQNGMQPNFLTFELTETAVMQELTSSLEVLNRLKMKGFHLSIDDFGTGYSSLSKLYDAPFDELKIDRRFTKDLLANHQAQTIVDICVMLAKALDMTLVAEGIEDEQTFEYLQRYPEIIGQGYWIAKPLSKEQFEQWFDSWNREIG